MTATETTIVETRIEDLEARVRALERLEAKVKAMCRCGRGPKVTGSRCEDCLRHAE